MTKSRCGLQGSRGYLGAWWRQVDRGVPATSKRRGAAALSRPLHLPHPQHRMPARRLIRRNRQSRVQRSCFLYDSRSPEVLFVLILQMSVTRKRSWSNLSSGVFPAARGRAVALRVEPLSKAQRLAPSGGHPSRGLAASLRARWRAGCRRAAAQGPGRCARQCSDQGCAFIAMRSSQVRPAVPAGMTTAARSRARGSRALLPSRVRERARVTN